MNEYWLLFSSGFISATLFPGGSEALYVYYLTQDISLKWMFFLVVTAGNSLGGIVTYLLGYYVQYGQEKALLKYPKTFFFCKKWGDLALMFSWLPIVGDIICLFAGWLRLPKARSFIYIIVGKSCRYLLLMLFFFLPF